VNRPLQPHDLRITDSAYGTTLALRRCRRCGFIFAEGDVADILRLYRQLRDPEYLESSDTRALQMQWLLNHVLERRPTLVSLLDVGAGSGLLVQAARRRGLDALGLEPSQTLVEYASRAGVPIVEGALPTSGLGDRTFDLVTLVDVIEHVAGPVELLAECGARLNPGGVLVVVTPNVRSIPARLMGKRWWHYRLAHIGYFSRPSLEVAASRANLAIVETFSTRWFFRLRYLAERADRYLPLQAINRAADHVGLLRRLYERTVGFDLHDSIGVILQSGSGRSADKRLPNG
jgi:2-polyprenyl-3-methyl-5-hydroxy-6-metoxy-1,4-benzoquinol methylase